MGKKKRKNKKQDIIVFVDDNFYQVTGPECNVNMATALALCKNAIVIGESNPQTALAQLNTAIELAPDMIPAYYSRGLLKKRLKDYRGALDDFIKMIEYGEKTKEVYWQKALAEVKLRLFKEALADYNAAIQLDSNDAELYSDRGIAYDSLGFHKEALQDYDRALELNPCSSIVYCNKGTLYSVLEDCDKAIECFTKAIELNEDFVEALFNRAICYYKLCKYDDAIKDFKYILKIEPEFYTAYCFLGAVMLECDNLEAAIQYVNKAIELEPDDICACFYKAKCMKLAGDTAEQKRCLKKTFNLQLAACNTLEKGNISLYLYRAVNENTIDSLKNNYLWFSERSALNDTFDSKFYEKLADEDLCEVVKEARIRSLSGAEEHYNTLMWGYYANGSRGIAIEYEFDIETLIENNIIINKVEYENSLRPQNTMPEFMDYGKTYFTKNLDWQHENEWRLIAKSENLKDGHKLFDFFKLKSITFGLETSDEDKKLIQSLVKGCKFYQMVCDDIISGEKAVQKISL